MTSGGRGHQKRPNAIAPEMDVLDDTPSEPPLTKEDYTHLADMRHALRAFARQTELELRTYHVSPQQYLLLLAIKGFPGRDWANITELAERLQIRHNAVIGLVNRAEKRGFVKMGTQSLQRRKTLLDMFVGFSMLNSYSHYVQRFVIML